MPGVRSWVASLGAVLALMLVAFEFWTSHIIDEGPAKYTLSCADLFLYFFPQYVETYARLARGVFPAWNPWQLCGIPWLATLQAGTFYPPHAVYLAMDTETAMAVSAWLHLLVALLGTYAFSRRVGLGILGSSAAAIGFSLRGNVLLYLVGPNQQEASVWLPVGAAGAWMIAEHPGPTGALLVAGATALSLLAGYPQLSTYLFYVWASLWLVRTVAVPAPQRRLLASIGWLGAGFAIGGLVAAVQLVPTAELTGLAVRQTSAMPGAAVMPAFNNGLLFFDYWAAGGAMVSFGVAMIALAVVAAAAVRHRPLLAGWSMGLGLLSAILALGPYTRLFDAFRLLPGISWFRGPHRILIITDFAMAMLAGLGVDAIAAGAAATARGRRWLSVGVAIVAGAVLSFCFWYSSPAYRVPAAAIAIVGVLTVIVRLPIALRSALALAAVGLLVNDVWINAADLNFMRPYTPARTRLMWQFADAYRNIAHRAGHERVWTMAANLDVPRALKLAAHYRFRALDDYEPLVTRRQAEFLTYLGYGHIDLFPKNLSFLGAVDDVFLNDERGSGIGARRRLLDVAAVRWVVMAAHQADTTPAKAFVRTAALEPPRPYASFMIYENRHALSRAWVVYRTVAAPAAPEDWLGALADPGFDPSSTAIVEQPASALLTPPDPPPAGMPATFVRDEETEVEMNATLTQPGLLVLADTDYPGWIATVDGQPAPIVRTNYLFRGVMLPSGTHVVRFEYRPRTIVYGIVGSLLGVVALLGVAIAAARGRPAEAA